MSSRRESLETGILISSHDHVIEQLCGSVVSELPVPEILETIVMFVVAGHAAHSAKLKKAGSEHEDNDSGVVMIRQATVELEGKHCAIAGKGC